MDRTGHDGASPELAALSEEHRAWALHAVALWREAREIVEVRPDLDVGDVYHALRTLELPPAERLRRGLTRTRLRAAGPRGAPGE